jgi:hypothetical protein
VRATVSTCGRRARTGALGLEEAAQEGPALLGEHPTGDVEAVVEARLARQVVQRAAAGGPAPARPRTSCTAPDLHTACSHPAARTPAPERRRARPAPRRGRSGPGRPRAGCAPRRSPGRRSRRPPPPARRHARARHVPRPERGPSTGDVRAAPRSNLLTVGASRPPQYGFCPSDQRYPTAAGPTGDSGEILNSMDEAGTASAATRRNGPPEPQRRSSLVVIVHSLIPIWGQPAARRLRCDPAVASPRRSTS